MSEAPALLEAITVTVGTIQTRARVYRWAVVGIAVALAVPVLSALVFLSWRPLPWVVLLVPVVGVFLVVDSWISLRWQRRVLGLWLSRALDLSHFRTTIGTMRHLPAGTVAGMLGRLPPSEVSERDRPAPSEASVAERWLDRTRRQDRRTLLATVGATLAACSVAVAASVWTIAPLGAALVGLLLIVSSRWVGGRDR